MSTFLNDNAVAWSWIAATKFEVQLQSKESCPSFSVCSIHLDDCIILRQQHWTERRCLRSCTQVPGICVCGAGCLTWRHTSTMDMHGVVSP